MLTPEQIRAMAAQDGLEVVDDQATGAADYTRQPKIDPAEKFAAAVGYKPDKTSGTALRQAFEKRGARYNEIQDTDYAGENMGIYGDAGDQVNNVARLARHTSNFAGGVADTAEATPIVGDVIDASSKVVPYVAKKGTERFLDQSPLLKGTLDVAKKGLDKLQETDAYQNAKSIVTDKVSDVSEQPRFQEAGEAFTDLARGIGTVEGLSFAGDVLNEGRKFATKKISTALAPDTDEVIQKDLTKYTQQALSPRGAKTGDQFTKQTQQKVDGIKLLQKKAPEIDIVDEDGMTVKFNPEKATFSDTVQAVSKTKDKVVKDMAEQLKTAGDEGVSVTVPEVKELLTERAAKGIDRESRKQAQDLLDDITEFENIHGDPLTGQLPPDKLHEFIQLKNKKLAASYRNGTIDTVTAEAMDMLRTKLDEVVERTTYGQEYGALKAIEQDIVREAQRLARQKGSGLEGFADQMGNIDLLMAFVTGNPAQAAKGLATKLFFKKLRASKSPELMLQKAFQKAAQLEKNALNKSQQTMNDTMNTNIHSTVPETEPTVKRPAKNMLSGSSPGFVRIGGEMKDVTRLVDKTNPYSKAASFLDETDRAPIEEFRNAVKNKTPISRKLTDDVDNIIEAINRNVGKQLINPYGTDMSKMKQLSLLKDADDALTQKAISQYDKAQAKLGTQKKSPAVANDLASEAKKYKSAEDFWLNMSRGSRNELYNMDIRSPEAIKNYWNNLKIKPTTEKARNIKNSWSGGSLDKTIYHGGDESFIQKLNSGKGFKPDAKRDTGTGGNLYGLSTSTNYNMAKDFSTSATSSPSVGKFKIDKSAKIFGLKGQALDDLSVADIKKIAKEYDVIVDIDNTGGEYEIRVLNPKVLKPNSN